METAQTAEESDGTHLMEIDTADVKPTLLSWATVGIMSVTFIVFFRWLFSKVRVPGLSDFFVSL